MSRYANTNYEGERRSRPAASLPAYETHQGPQSGLAETLPKYLGPVAAHWFSEVSDSAEGEAALSVTREKAAEAALTRSLQDHDTHLDAVFTAMRDDPAAIAAFLGKLRASALEFNIPAEGPVEYDALRGEIFRPDPTRQQAATQQIEQGDI
jgi:hypothetical protein